MTLEIVLEYNESGCLAYIQNLAGAFTRGRTEEEAFAKLAAEARCFEHWKNGVLPDESFEHGLEIVTVLKKKTELHTEQADSDIIFDTERLPLSESEYIKQKALALKSAKDFQLLYDSVPDKSEGLTPERNCFYGHIPNTAEQMYLHTMNVNSYYFGEIDVPAENGPDILSCRARAFERLEQQKNFLSSGVFDGSYDEQWSLGKVLRRFIWHDRIHAKAMYRSAAALFGKENIANPFFFE